MMSALSLEMYWRTWRAVTGRSALKNSKTRPSMSSASMSSTVTPAPSWNTKVDTAESSTSAVVEVSSAVTSSGMTQR